MPAREVGPGTILLHTLIIHFKLPGSSIMLQLVFKILESKKKWSAEYNFALCSMFYKCMLTP